MYEEALQSGQLKPVDVVLARKSNGTKRFQTIRKWEGILLNEMILLPVRRLLLKTI